MSINSPLTSPPHFHDSEAASLLPPDDDSVHIDEEEEDWSQQVVSTSTSPAFHAGTAPVSVPVTPASSHRTQHQLPSPKEEPPTEEAGEGCCAAWLGAGSAVLWLFTLCQMMIFYDRGMVAGMLPSIQRDVGDLSDTEAGVLGSGFIFGYMLACPMFAFFSKSYSPYKLMALGLFLWSNATLLCGLTTNFSTLLVARILTGVGEASFAGLAPTCIDDVAPAAHRTIWLSFFFSGIPLGSALGYIAGGYWAKIGWQYGFIAESIMMLPLVAIVFFWPNHESEAAARKNAGATAAQGAAIKRSNSFARIATRPAARRARAQWDAQRPKPGTSPAPDEETGGDTEHLAVPPHTTPPVYAEEHLVMHRADSAPQLSSSTTIDLYSAQTVDDDDEKHSGDGGENKEPATLSVNPAATPSRGRFAQQARQARTPSLASRYVRPDPSNPFHAPGNSNYQESKFAVAPPSPLQDQDPTANLPTPSSYNPHYDAQQEASRRHEDEFVTDIVTLLTDGVYIVVVLGYAALAFVIGALSFWGPVDFSKNLHIGIGRSTKMIGVITFCCGLGGTFFGGWLLDYRGGTKGIFAVISALELCCVCTTIAIGFAISAVVSLDLTTSMVCLSLADFFLFATGPPVNAALLSVAPKSMRSLAMAMSILLMHALGDLPSPFLMGFLTDQLHSIQFALICLCLWLIWTVLFWGIGVYLARGRAEAFKEQLRHDMSIPAHERSALLGGQNDPRAIAARMRRGSTGQFYAQNPEFYDQLSQRPSQHRPWQYYDSSSTAFQPYHPSQFRYEESPALARHPRQYTDKIVRASRSHDRTPPAHSRAFDPKAAARQIPVPPHQEGINATAASTSTPGTYVHGLPIYDASGKIVGFAQHDATSTPQPKAL